MATPHSKLNKLTLIHPGGSEQEYSNNTQAEPNPVSKLYFMQESYLIHAFFTVIKRINKHKYEQLFLTLDYIDFL